MNNKTTRLRSAVLLSAALLAWPALAQRATPSTNVQRTYQEELAMCDHIQQDRAACIREAGAARQQANQPQPNVRADYTANALARCAVHPPTERTACEARITGSGQSSVQGSVLGGGLIRESVTTVTMPAPPPPPPQSTGETLAPRGPTHVSPMPPMRQGPEVMVPTPAPVVVPQQPVPRALP